MAPKSLADLCITVCHKNSKEITDVGGLPYSIVRPILIRIDNPAQLRAIEEASPHIAFEDAECWLRLIDKKFAVLHNLHQLEPRNPALWHKVYAKYARQDADQKAEAEAKLKNAFAGLQKRKAANSSSVVDLARSSLPRPPRDMRNVGRKPAIGRRGGNTDTGELRFTAGSRTKTNTAASVMRRVKREAAEVRARNKLATPNGALPVRTGQIKHAPQGMVHEQRVRSNPAVKIHPPTSTGVVGSEGDPFRDRVMEEREARLRKLKAQGKTLSIMEDSDFDDDDDDDIFGSGGGGGGLNVEDLEDLFDEDDEDDGHAASPPRRGAALPGKKKSLLSNSYRSGSQQQTQKATQASSSRSRSPTRAAPSSSAAPPMSPPPKYAPPAGSPELKPRMPVKRKAVDVFMKKKPKVQRR